MEITDRMGAVARPLYGQLAKRLSDQISKLGEASQVDDGDPVLFTELLLRDAVNERVSDIHLEPHAGGMRVRFRIDGVLLDTMSLPLDTGGTLLRHLKALGGLDPLPAARPASAGRTIVVGSTTVDARTTVAPCVFGEKLTVRLLDVPQQVQQIGRLGMNGESEEQVRGWLEHVTGTFVVCGPTGSGKTTTLYSLLHELKNTNRSVVTVEDPVEYRVEGITQMEVDAQHKLTFAEGLRASLRLDPDYLMLGEIRDEDTARVAMSAAGTGRVLMTTLHSKDAVGTLTALRNWGVDDFQLASALRVVVSQRLVRTLCDACKEESDGPDPIERDWLENIGRQRPRRMWRAVGCSQCNDLGYVGRTGVFEVWRVDGGDAELILEHVDDHKMRDHLRERGHLFMVDDAIKKVEDGRLDIRQIRHLASG